MNFLLTGFEPFDESGINPSEQVAQALAGQSIEGIQVCAAVLPVDRARGPAELIRAVQQCQPRAVVCLGQATRRAVISLERVAINLLDYRIADNAGHQAVDEPIAPGGPAAYFVTLPVRAMLQAIRAVGVPAELSLSAGAFLCNQVTYELLHYLAVNQINIPAGFVHLPLLPEQAACQPGPVPSMSLDTMLKGVTAAIRAIASSVPGGPRLCEERSAEAISSAPS